MKENNNMTKIVLKRFVKDNERVSKDNSRYLRVVYIGDIITEKGTKKDVELRFNVNDELALGAVALELEGKEIEVSTKIKLTDAGEYQGKEFGPFYTIEKFGTVMFATGIVTNQRETPEEKLAKAKKAYQDSLTDDILFE